MYRRAHRRCATHDPQSGVTLIELMVVLAITAMLAVAVGKSFSRPGTAASANETAYRVWMLTKQARAMSIQTGFLTRIVFGEDKKSIFLERAPNPGITIPSSSTPWVPMQRDTTRGDTLIAGLSIGAVTGPVSDAPSPWCPDGPICKVIFFPDGSASAAGINPSGGATVFVQDESQTYVHKIVIFGLTGFSQHISRW